jgi:hypothetical protein
MVSGALIQSLSAHFMKVNAVKMVEGWIVSAGEDANVHFFSIANVMKGILQPSCSAGPHTMPITDLCVRWPMVYTASLDGSCAILNRNTVIEHVTCGSAINSVEVRDEGNWIESSVYLAGNDGYIYIHTRKDNLRWKIDE